MNFAKPLFITIAITAFQVSAETVYRSVDEQGNVTFSDKPLSGAAKEEQVSIDAPAPSTERQQEAQRKEAERQKAVGQARTPSAAPGKADQKKAAKQAVLDAEKRLEETRQVHAGDRIGTAEGGSRLTTDYLERVREAEAEVEQARKHMEETR